jgi:predicted  nucleic acid-binding Zn-ribbon protein
MSMQSEMIDMARRIAMDEVTQKEVDVAIIQILSSMYNEKQRDREHLARIEKSTQESLTRIEEKIEGRNEEHDERYKKIDKLEKKVDYIMYIVGLLTVVTSIVAGWAIPRILDTIFN